MIIARVVDVNNKFITSPKIYDSEKEAYAALRKECYTSGAYGEHKIEVYTIASTQPFTIEERRIT